MVTKKLCASCLKFNFNKTLKSNKKNKPKWLFKKDYVEEFVEKYKNFNINFPNKYNKIIKLYIGKENANKKILYWAAKPLKNNELLINDAKNAYGNFSNSGVSKIDNNGFALIKFLIPQNYKTITKNGKKFQTFFKHLHYVISNSDNNKWNSQIYTKLIHNNYNYNTFIKKLKSKTSIILNVLPSEIYAKNHIPNTYNLPYNNIKKMSINELIIWFKDIIELHYSTIKKYINNKKLDYYEIPIICYCAHEKCNASKIACENLMKKGFVNVSLFEGGMREFMKKI